MGGVFYFLSCAVHQAEHHHIQAMHEPGLTDETLGLLGDDQQQRGQALKLG